MSKSTSVLKYKGYSVPLHKPDCIKSLVQDAIYMYQKFSSRCYLHASKVHFKTLSTCIKSSIEDATYMLKESQNVLHPVSPNLLLKFEMVPMLVVCVEVFQ